MGDQSISKEPTTKPLLADSHDHIQSRGCAVVIDVIAPFAEIGMRARNKRKSDDIPRTLQLGDILATPIVASENEIEIILAARD